MFVVLEMNQLLFLLFIDFIYHGRTVTTNSLKIWRVLSTFNVNKLSQSGIVTTLLQK